jgi:hypothetical protein
MDRHRAGDSRRVRRRGAIDAQVRGDDLTLVYSSNWGWTNFLSKLSVMPAACNK